MKIFPVGAELCHADRRTDGGMGGQTDMTQLRASFRNYANTPKNCYWMGWQK